MKRIPLLTVLILLCGAFLTYFLLRKPASLEQRLSQVQRLVLHDPASALFELEGIVADHPKSSRALRLAADSANAAGDSTKATDFLYRAFVLSKNESPEKPPLANSSFHCAWN